MLESVNGQSMANADHREAVRAVKESKGALTVVRFMHVQTSQPLAQTAHFPSQTLRRRRHAHPLVVGIVSAVNSVPHVDPTVTAKPEEYNFSLLVNSKDST